MSLIHQSRNRLLYDEMRYDRHVLENEHKRLMETMTQEQKHVYDTIMSGIDANLPSLFFVYGYGGTGKTFIWRALSSAIRSIGEIVLTVASSGIVALLTPSDTRIPFKFQQRQFPLSVCFAMTINKSQGQSLKQVGVYFQQPVFLHGQLYVAISKVTSRGGLKILTTDENGVSMDSTLNVVYKEIFRNVLT